MATGEPIIRAACAPGLPSVAEARTSVAWSLFFIALLYLSVPALALMVKFEVLNHLVGSRFDALPTWMVQWSKVDASLLSFSDVNGDGLGDVLVGSRFYDNGSPDEGAIFLFLGGSPMNADIDAVFDVNQGSAYMGYSVAGIGDTGPGGAVGSSAWWPAGNPSSNRLTSVWRLPPGRMCLKKGGRTLAVQ